MAGHAQWDWRGNVSIDGLLEPAGVGRRETGAATSPSQANPTLWRAMDGQEHKAKKDTLGFKHDKYNQLIK